MTDCIYGASEAGWVVAYCNCPFCAKQRRDKEAEDARALSHWKPLKWSSRLLIAAVLICLAGPLFFGFWQTYADSYRRDHGCLYFVGLWWGNPAFDSSWICPANGNYIHDTGYLMRVLHVQTFPELTAIFEAETERLKREGK